MSARELNKHEDEKKETGHWEQEPQPPTVSILRDDKHMLERSKVEASPFSSAFARQIEKAKEEREKYHESEEYKEKQRRRRERREAREAIEAEERRKEREAIRKEQEIRMAYDAGFSKKKEELRKEDEELRKKEFEKRMKEEEEKRLARLPGSKVFPYRSSSRRSGYKSDSRRPSDQFDHRSGLRQQSSTVNRQMAETPLSAQSIGEPWLINAAEKARFDSIYATIDTQNQGFISGDQAVQFFGNARLPEDVLTQIWDLADVNSDGVLNRDEFAVAMYLIRQQRSSRDSRVPNVLPTGLIPPSMRKQQQPSQPATVPAFEDAPMTKPKSAADDLFDRDWLTEHQPPMPMPLSSPHANIIPNFEGFKHHILELNPYLASYLADRIAHHQLRRYKRLVKNRVDHINACTQGKCQSGHRCSSVGGKAKILPPTTSTSASFAQFEVALGPDSDNDNAGYDGIVTPAAFPDDLPLPPTKKLPARFECPLCFQVKKFHNPSEWVKHVHEDVQPFTCTFRDCNEPRSFKRKADWVRHENERHRHLEWWKCNISDCTHVCYRRDNMVQHLVLEHKLKELRVKRRLNSNKKVEYGFKDKDQDFWDTVDQCRHESATDSKSEPCKFCGNVCASWKKLSVHVGKHMEQIASPVLDLVHKRYVTKDTIVSPIIEPVEPPGAHQNFFKPIDHNGVSGFPSEPYSSAQDPDEHEPESNIAESPPDRLLLSYRNRRDHNRPRRDAKNEPSEHPWSHQEKHGEAEDDGYKDTSAWRRGPSDRDNDNVNVDREWVDSAEPTEPAKVHINEDYLPWMDIMKNKTLAEEQQSPSESIQKEVSAGSGRPVKDRGSGGPSRYGPTHLESEFVDPIHKHQSSGSVPIPTNISMPRGPQTDSGYASWRAPEDKQLQTQELSDPHRSDEHDHFATLETKTTYSDGASVDTTKRDDFVQRFAELLLNDMTQGQSGAAANPDFPDDIDEILADFAIRLGQDTSSSELRKAMIFIHKYRSSLSRVLQQKSEETSDEESDEERSTQDKPLLHDIMQMWFDRESDPDGQAPFVEELENIRPLAEQPPELDETDTKDYERLIASTPAYQWLIASLRNRLLLTTASDTISHIRSEVCKFIAKPMHLSKMATANLTEAQFEMDCNFDNFDGTKDGSVIDSTLTVTGSVQEAQALTCTQYIQQTWPMSGILLWQIVKDAVLTPGKIVAYENTNTFRLSARLYNYRLIVTIVGLRGVLLETAEQLCWMSGALNFAFSTRHDGILLCLPSLERVDRKPSHRNEKPLLDDEYEYSASSRSELKATKQKNLEVKYPEAYHCFKIKTEYQRYLTSSDPGTCWQYFFKNCVIIQDFPIRRRSKPGLGLELSFELMAILMGTKYLHRFSERPCFKQFFTMLVPSSQDDEMVTWHLCKSKDNHRISYLDHEMPDLGEIDYNTLLKARHIIGWCSNIKHFAGHAAGTYDVESSILRESPPTGSLFNCQLSFGRPVAGASVVCFSGNHQRASLSQRNYLDMFRFLERRFVLIWDTNTSRGWLINGLRALLHLLRQSLRFDEKEGPGGLFVLKPKDLIEPTHQFGARAAREFLTKPENLSAKVSISAIHATGSEYETLGERFERIYDVVEQAFDYQSKCRNWDQIPRSYLEGWDFLSVARKDDTIQSSMFMLPPSGKTWVDFVRAVGVVTFMGEGFGELLQPGTVKCDSMPCDRFYLAVSMSDLSEIMNVNRCKLSMQPRLICRSPRIIWYSPSGSLNLCGCKSNGKSKSRESYVQVMWPAEQRSLLPVEDSDFSLQEYPNGAVIFGHDDSLKFYLPEFGQTLVCGPSSYAPKELETIDSGIGSSLDSTTDLDRIPTRSTGSLFDNPQLSLDRSNSQGQPYGSSFMSGGCGVYGNITGNLYVNQYLGSRPDHITSATSLQVPQVVPQMPGPAIQHDERPDEASSLQNQASPLPPLENKHDDQDNTDIEMQQGQMEIRALGLDDYCNIFRF